MKVTSPQPPKPGVSFLGSSVFKNLFSSGSFNALLRELVAEFTLTDNSANTTTSLLRSLCHYDDSVLMGSWLQETDHKSIEDQVLKIISCDILIRYCDIQIAVLVCHHHNHNLACTDAF